jgi:hypothetical protein
MNKENKTTLSVFVQWRRGTGVSVVAKLNPMFGNAAVKTFVKTHKLQPWHM